MQFEITAPRRLTGETGLPGDRLFTLSVLALAALGGNPVELRGISTAPDSVALQRFLRNAGVSLSGDGDAIVLWGNGYRGTVDIPPDVPDEVLHLIVPAAVFSAERVMIDARSPFRETTLGSLLPLLHALGLPAESVRESETGWEIRGSGLTPPELLELGSDRDLEAVAVAALAAGVSPRVSFSRTEAGPALSFLRSLGLRAEGDEPAVENTALARRLARLSGERKRETLKIEWEFRGKALEIPGDATLAAALAGAATLIPRSEIILRGVLWEPGRRGFFECLKRMKAGVEWSPRKNTVVETADVRVRSAIPEGIRTTSQQARTMTAELPLLAAVATVARGETIIRSTGPGVAIDFGIRKTLAIGLEALGAHIGDYPEGIVVKGGPELRGNLVDAGENPTVALALTMAGQAAAGKTVIFGYDGDAYPVGPYRRIIEGLSVNRKPSGVSDTGPELESLNT